MPQATSPAASGLGFLTVVQESNGYLGGYLVTNQWGRPLEFRLSSAVQPNRMQQILYGPALQPYLYADLIGKTLVEKTATPAQCVFTDCPPVLELRLHLDVPVACVPGPAAAATNEAAQASPLPVRCHPRFPADQATLRQLLERLDGSVNLAEPFVRIREAMSEARKLGALHRN